MASPILQQLPKSPMAPIRGLTAGFQSTPRFRILSPDNSPIGQPTEKTPSMAGAHGVFDASKLSPSPQPDSASNTSRLFASPLRFAQHHDSRRQSFSCTPSAASKSMSPPFLNSPALALQFSATRACEALIQSPCRATHFSRQRRRLYHCDHNHNDLLDLRPTNFDREQALRLDLRKSSANGEEMDHMAEGTGLKSKAAASGLRIVRSDSMRLDSASSIGTPAVTPKLGKGGFGSVYIGRYDGQRVAIKQLYSRKQEGCRAKEQSFCAELNAFRLHHPNIVTIITFTSCGPVTQVVFEYVGQRNLQQVLDDTETEPLDFCRRHRFATDLANALCYCHEHRLLHLDVKPANVLLADHDDKCKLADFGCSRSFSGDCSSGELVSPVPPMASKAGTLIYKAPELLKGLQPTTKADVFSFAMVVWQCLSREMPYKGQHPHSVVFQVVASALRPSTELDCLNAEEPNMQLLNLVEMCWVQDPDIRPEFGRICEYLSDVKW